MKDWILLSVQPGDLFFLWQLNVQLHNFRKLGISNRYHIVIYVAPEREVHPLFFALEKEYHEATFEYIYDNKGTCWHLIQSFNYIPLLRPWCLQKYFTKYPELGNKAIFYLDSDVIFTKYPDFIDGLLQDDVCYLSDTKSYISASYFDSKVKDVIPKRLESYQKRDILEECANNIGITRRICEDNEEHTGGAQYLLKGIDAKFWGDVLDGCMVTRLQLTAVNDKYFPSEEKGFQVWCADMWAVLWNLWKRGIQTRTPECMDFIWSTSPIDLWKKKYIYHDAGAADGCFNKMRYRENTFTPYRVGEDFSHINLNNCSSKYVEELLDSKQTFNNLKV